ncbi:MAG: hypothetical protein ACYSWO_07590 [Planctomycetota bacterium]|jgi:hypothetical protein
MYRLAIVFLCCCVIGCEPASTEKSETFEERQKQLFNEIDHTLVYEGCQELMAQHRDGMLSRTTFYSDDPKTVQDELPKALRSLRATYVRVDEMMVNINFHSEDGMQVLRCFSNEFGEPSSRPKESKGLGFRTDPFDMDKLSGAESLEHLNETYHHFEMELMPGLTYEKYPPEEADRPEDVKQSNEQMDMMMRFMNQTIRELAVKKQRLLYRTDHDALLKACRQAIARYNNGAYSKAKVNMIDASSSDLEQIPRIILDLEPVYVWFSKDRVMVALTGGMDHAGVYGYAKSEDEVLHDDQIRLINGLVYYDDGLREADDDYKDYLKSLEHEAIPYLDWKRKQMNLPIPKREDVPIEGGLR